MRRFARRLFTLCAAVSLGLLLALLSGYVLPTRLYESRGPGRWVAAWLVGGRVSVQTANAYPAAGEGFEYATVRSWGVVDVRHADGTTQANRVVAVTVPLAVPALIAAILPTAWLALRTRRRRGSRRRAANLCPFCGYDLRANPERCPECGAAAAR